MGLRLIEMSDGEPVGNWKAAVRDLAHYLDFLVLYIGFICRFGMLGGRRWPTR